ncbi:MFS transporter [Clostridium culturomicium]|uniref:MFS transporter n=1 Tax=Clostridium culturomicium TaxID=1499683 RepID=UPI00058C0B1C|nr:MFS transporter [Clostridium culturomicium]
MEENQGGEKKIKLWNKDFFLLWQGQLVSYLGDVIYSFALSFWVLNVTGSTALMGILQAASMAPRLIIGPFAGVLVDKWDRKKIIVIADVIRGVLSTFVGIAALSGFLEVWMVFVVGVVTSVCSAFFNPAITSVKPDIVDKSKLVKANSVTSLAQAGASSLGSAVSGVIYVVVGAPYMFLFDGISYLFSAFTEMFISIPNIKRNNGEVTFIEDFKSGLSFVWNFKALRNMFIISCGLNFFFNAAFVLMLPLFNEASYLGAEKYGFLMAMSSVGMIIGSGLLSVVNIKNNKRYLIIVGTFLPMAMLFLLIPIVNNYYIILAVATISFALNIMGNTIFDSVLMTIIPEEKRGKVFALINTFSMGLTPLGLAVGGILGEILPIRIAMLILLCCTLLLTLAFAFIKGLRPMINFDPEVEDVETLITRTNKISYGEKSCQVAAD